MVNSSNQYNQMYANTGTSKEGSERQIARERTQILVKKNRFYIFPKKK